MVYYGEGIDVNFIDFWANAVVRSHLKAKERKVENLVDLLVDKNVQNLKREIAEIFKEQPKTREFFFKLGRMVRLNKYTNEDFGHSFVRFWRNLVIEMSQEASLIDEKFGSVKSTTLDLIEDAIEGHLVEYKDNAICFYRQMSGIWATMLAPIEIVMQYIP